MLVDQSDLRLAREASGIPDDLLRSNDPNRVLQKGAIAVVTDRDVPPRAVEEWVVDDAVEAVDGDARGRDGCDCCRGHDDGRPWPTAASQQCAGHGDRTEPLDPRRARR